LSSGKEESAQPHYGLWDAAAGGGYEAQRALRVVSYPLSVFKEAGGDAAEERLHGHR